jgi:4-amino-4-deoxy-L-arabinose transferase-like glycosyltransferase
MQTRWRLIAAVLSLAAVIGVVSTYSVFSQTSDEPAHIACGMEWLSRGTYTYDGAQHPPLTRVLAALGPYSRGARSLGKINEIYEGDLILDRGPEYRIRLFLARLGELPFLILLCAASWLWGRRLLGEIGGALTVLLVVTNPNILAHAGLATTDIGITATMAAALYSYVRWTANRTRRNAVWFGLWMALAALTKFTALPYIGLTILLAEIWRWYIARSKREPWGFPAGQLGVSVVVGLLVLWAGYRFDFGPSHPGGVPVPAPALFRGLGTFLGHASRGHAAFLLGETSMTGWWYYFPVALAVKTPLPLLLLGIVGMAGTVTLMRRREFEPAIPLFVVIAIMAVGVTAHVDIGVRHILPLYPFLALLGARGAIDLWTRADSTRFVKGVTTALAASALFIVVRAHPDHLAYFNPLAGARPDRILVDSNLDWGQDLYRLADVVRKLRIDSVRVAYFGTADMQWAGVPNARRLEPNEAATGFVAASRTNLAGVWVGPAYQWLYKYQVVGTVGPSLVLFYVPPGSDPRTRTPGPAAAPE